MRRLLRRDGDVPLLSLTLTRPTVFEQHADWIERRHRAPAARPEAAGQGLSQELAEALLQRIAAVPAALRALITDGAEGNPFYMEELVKMLIDDGVIAVEAEGWRVLPDKLLTAHVPPTLTGVLQARLDALALRERTRAAAGRGGRPCVLGPGAGGHRPGAVDALPLLLRKQLVVRRDAPASTTRRIRLPASPAAPGDLRQRAEGASASAATSASARSGARAPKSKSPAGRRPGGVPRAGRGALPSPPRRRRRPSRPGSTRSSSTT